MSDWKMVTLEEVESVWGNAKFGSMSKMDVVKYGLLKRAGMWDQGYTSRQILINLGLVTPKTNKLTKRGARCLYEFFKDDKSV